MGTPTVSIDRIDTTKPTLSFETTILDTPQFRNELSKYENEFKSIEEQLKVLMKSSKKLVDSTKTASQCSSAVATDIQALAAIEAEDPVAVRAYNRISAALLDIEQHRTMVYEQTTKTLIDPMKTFIDVTLTEVKEGKKVYEQLSGNLDSARTKFCSVSKKREDEFSQAKNVLDASHNVFTYMSLDYVYQVNKVIAQRRYEVLEKVVSYMFSQLSFYHQCYETLRELEPQLRMLMSECQLRAEQLKVLDREMEKRHELVAVQRAEAAAETHLQALERRTEVQLSGVPSILSPAGSNFSIQNDNVPSTPASPRISAEHSGLGNATPMYADDLPAAPSPAQSRLGSPSLSSAPPSFLPSSPALGKNQKPALRKGYLFARGAKKGSRSWYRYYVFIQDSTLYFQLREPGSKPFVAAHLHLCTVKPHADVDRRFCFELITPQTNITLQAMDQQSMNAWIASLQAQIGAALDAQHAEPRESSLSSSITSQATAASIELLNELLSVDGNDCCCDCGHPDATWAAINLGIVLCIECSGVHRRMGTHVSKVRSVKLDKWDPESVALMKGIGNKRFNGIYEAVPVTDDPELTRPTPSTDRVRRERWIRAKYITHRFCEPSRGPREECELLFDACKEHSPEGLVVAVAAVARGAFVDWQAPEHDMWAPLHVCANWDNRLVGEFLVQNLATVNICDMKSRTPLHVAAEMGKTEFVLFLLKRGARYDPKDEDGKTPLDLATAQEHPEIVTHLRLYDLNVKEEESRRAARDRKLNALNPNQPDEDFNINSPLMSQENFASNS